MAIGKFSSSKTSFSPARAKKNMKMKKGILELGDQETKVEVQRKREKPKGDDFAKGGVAESESVSLKEQRKSRSCIEITTTMMMGFRVRTRESQTHSPA